MTVEPRTLDPLLQLEDYSYFVTRLAFDQLVTVDAGGQTLLPRLAAVVPTVRNGGISRDGRVLTYRLRRDVRWQDGAPFTSADVKFTFDAIANPKNDVPDRRGFALVRDVETPDPHTVVVRLARPFAPAITWFFGDGGNNYAILPKHILERQGDLNRAAFNGAPIGTGPFRIVRWRRGQEIDLAANDGYYRGPPKLRTIVVRFVPDEATALAQLRTHESDLFTEASLYAFAQIRTLPQTAYALTDIHGATTVLMNNRRPVLRDVRVRRAIEAAIDKRAIAAKVAFGAPRVATADLPPFMPAFDDSVRDVAYDPVAARSWLRDAGYVPGPDGIVVRAGQRLTLELAYAETSAIARVGAVQVQAYLHAIGIDLVLKAYSGQQMFAGYGAGGIYQTGNFDLAWYTMTLGIDPDSSGRFACASIPPHGQNYSRYCNADVDAAEALGVSHVDPRVRKRAYAIVQRALARDVPLVFLFWEKNVDAYNPDLRGFRPNPVTASWNAAAWSI